MVANTQKKMNEIDKMNEMDLADVLSDILVNDIIIYNKMHNVEYFKQRMENEQITNELMDEAIVILEELLNSGGFEKQVSIEKPENQAKRRENLNELIKICEKIAGIVY